MDSNYERLSMTDDTSDVAQRQYDWDADVPTSPDVLPDGRDTIVIGDVTRHAEGCHKQGDNPYGFEGTCGLCSCANIIRQFGGDATEAIVVTHAVAHRECAISKNPEKCGATRIGDQIKVLRDFGIPAHAERRQSLEDLAAAVGEGRGVIIEANAGYLWNDRNHLEFGQANHAVVVTGVARDPGSGRIQGFYINDSGSGQAGHFTDAATMTHAWVDAGGQAVITDVTHTRAAGEPFRETTS